MNSKEKKVVKKKTRASFPMGGGRWATTRRWDEDLIPELLPRKEGLKEVAEEHADGEEQVVNMAR